MQLSLNEVHVWHTTLPPLFSQQDNNLLFLNAQEIERAERFHFKIHQARFIAAHFFLRQVLSCYIDASPKEIIFSFDAHQKPFLPHDTLQFNLSHSHDIAICAVTMKHAVGVDIEKMESRAYEDITERFFSEHENAALKTLPISQKMSAFFRLWTRKEAIVKAIGKGLFCPLNSFTVSSSPTHEIIKLEDQSWTLLSLDIHPDYQAALATNQVIQSIQYFDFLVNNH